MFTEGFSLSFCETIHIENWQYLRNSSLLVLICFKKCAWVFPGATLSRRQDYTFTWYLLVLFLDLLHSLYCSFFIFVFNHIWKVVFQDARCQYTQWQLTRKTSYSLLAFTYLKWMTWRKAGDRLNYFRICFSQTSEITVFLENQCQWNWVNILKNDSKAINLKLILN